MMLIKSLLPLGLLAYAAAAAAAAAIGISEVLDVFETATTFDSQTISVVFDIIGKRLDVMTSDIIYWGGSPTDATQILSDSRDVVNEMNSGIERISRSEPVPFYDTMRLGLTSTATLVSRYESMVDAVKSKKRQMDNINFSYALRRELERQRDTADKLRQTISSKMPGGLSFDGPRKVINQKLDYAISTLGGSQSSQPRLPQGSPPPPSQPRPQQGPPPSQPRPQQGPPPSQPRPPPTPAPRVQGPTITTTVSIIYVTATPGAQPW